jgi:nicotinamide-nucleotide amidase
MNNLKEKILDISRQNSREPLSPWFDNKLDEHLGSTFYDEGDLLRINEGIIVFLRKYARSFGVNNVVIGMSGGVDSALTAALFNAAGWKVHGITMPINQNPSETARAKEVLSALDLPLTEVNLTKAYDDMLYHLYRVDNEIDDPEVAEKSVLIRRGNVRARLRMITLYNLAAKVGGLVASTDNFSELASGFWTRFGDEGDVAPIRNLYKSWEVPMLAKLNGIPGSVWRATPTDGLGIDAGDESQFGFSYLELDIIISELMKNDLCSINESVNGDKRAVNVLASVLTRMKKTWFKRAGTIQYAFNKERFTKLKTIDDKLINSDILKDIC